MKKLLAVILTCLMLFSAVSGCTSGKQAKNDGSSSAKSEAVSSQSKNKKKQIYLFIQNRGDLSYWDSMAEGGDKASKDFADKADVHVIETPDTQTNLTAMYEAADKGADMIITAEKDNLIQVAKEYPNIAMVIMMENCVDAAKNIYGFDFQTSQASFLAGIAAADVASHGIEGTSKSKTVGFIGGMDEYIVIQEFFLGFIQGAKYYDPSTKVVYNYVGAFNDPDTARTQALTQFNDAKADVIFSCAGGSGNGVHKAASEVKKYVIGVDSDQSLMYKEDKEIQSRFVTSVLKFSGKAVYDTIKKFLDEGTLPFGTYDIIGVKTDAVGLVYNDLFNKYVSEDGKKKIEEAKKGIKDGTINVAGALGKDETEVKALIDKYINQ